VPHNKFLTEVIDMFKPPVIVDAAVK